MILPGRKNSNGTLGGPTMYQNRGWNDCLDEVEKLNTVEGGKPNVGELWLVKIGDDPVLDQVKVVNFSSLTVMLDFAPGLCQTSVDGQAINLDARGRYLLQDVRFVERINEST